MDLTTRYMGLTLAHPFIVGASPLSAHLDTVRRLEDGRAAAIVLHSLFEEQITLAQTGRIHHMDPFEAEFVDAWAGFPVPNQFDVLPDEYLDHVRQVKAAVHDPQQSSAAIEAGMQTVVADASFEVMRDGPVQCMAVKGGDAIGDGRGRVDGASASGTLFERANAIRTLQSWEAEGR